MAVKHYLRGEEGPYYADLYPLIKFLPSYNLPTSITQAVVGGDTEAENIKSEVDAQEAQPTGYGTAMKSPTQVNFGESDMTHRNNSARTSDAATLSATAEDSATLPLPATSPSQNGGKKPNFIPIPPNDMASRQRRPSAARSPDRATPGQYPPISARTERSAFSLSDPNSLLPARLPPKRSAFDVFPLSLFGKILVKGGIIHVSGRKAAKLRAKLGGRGEGNKNLPLEISFYLVSVITISVLRILTNE